jgi:hypothetical protein
MMRMFVALATAACGALLAGCAGYGPTVPPGYFGPLASIRDSGMVESQDLGQLFYLAAVDGQPVYSSLEQTRRQSQRNNYVLTLDFVEQTVPARSLRLKIAGRHVTPGRAQALGLRAEGRYLEIEKELSFLPEPNGRYRVAGRLQPAGSDVWIEDARTSRRVTP